MARRTAWLLIILLMSLNWFQTVTFADEPDDDEVVLRQMYESVDRLLVEKNVDALSALLTKDFTFSGTDGKKETKEQWCASLREQVKGLVRSRTRVDSITLHTSSAEVKTWNVAHFDFNPTRRFIIRAGSVDKWIKTTQGWRIKSSEQNSVDIETL